MHLMNYDPKTGPPSSGKDLQKQVTPLQWIAYN